MDKEPKKPQNNDGIAENLVPLAGALVTGRTAGKIAASGVYKVTRSKSLATIAFIGATAGTAYASYSPLQKLTQMAKDKFGQDADDKKDDQPKTEEDKINDRINDMLNKLEPTSKQDDDNQNKKPPRKGRGPK